ncbi:hypothetical protein K413DRAFT_4650 [Clostridium sp. ASBs410]|nr:hypothetical protein K413DRAFT_4650 [Clostridium sp. ASBs410]
MYRERLVACRDCKDKFKIIYDSRKKYQDRYTCKCGKLVCYPDSFGGFSYDKGGSYEEIPHEERESQFKYYDEDFIRLTEEENILLRKIDSIGNELKESHYGAYTNLSDEDRIYLHLDGCSKSNEGLTISLEIRLKSYGSGWYEVEVKNKHERIFEGLNRFFDIIIKVKNKEIDLDNPRKIWNDDSLEWNDGTRTQQKIYDYELCC